MNEAVEKYCQSAASDSPTRIKLFRLAFHVPVSSVAGRQQLYERYYSGDPLRLAGALYESRDKKTYIDRVHGLVDDLERRIDTGLEKHGFGPREGSRPGG